MRRILWWLGVLFGFAVARTLDAGWVTFWFVGRHAFDLPAQAVIDGFGLAAAGMAAGTLARWLAGWSATGVGLSLAALLLLATRRPYPIIGFDFGGIANIKWSNDIITISPA